MSMVSLETIFVDGLGHNDSVIGNTAFICVLNIRAHLIIYPSLTATRGNEFYSFMYTDGHFQMDIYA